jgi:hypothetical protein|nr:MAG TPA: PilA, PilC, PilN, PilO, PilM, pilus, ring, membrane channel [Caudoviricetes sp.]
MITAILTGLFFGGIFYIIFGFWEEKEHIANQMKYIQQQQEQQQEVKRRQRELEKIFNEKWKRLEVQEK